ncbi:hypothetical protein WDV85_15630 [Pseudokineococcus sp. 5B2Z-1]|uniref:hypothetical protein n=1 Tax=Pseudokineococcus sp. 5B2Z-1 TaxID=3132744 RepID=UPI0030984611
MSDGGVLEDGGPVPARVLAAFGLSGRQQPLLGGRGLAVRVGEAVLLPAPGVVASAWASEVAGRFRSSDVRLPRPLRSGDGRWVVDGWSAGEHVDGVESPAGRWRELLDTARALHAALSREPVPRWLAGRRDPWADADRAAWGETTPRPGAVTAPLVARLLGARGALPQALPDQLVHGDLTGNVLLPRREGHGAPTVIDLSPYRRPAAAAVAVVVADGLLWHDAGPELVALADLGPCGPQLLVRALLFRLLALDALTRDRPAVTAAELPAHEAAARLVLALPVASSDRP